LFFGAGFIIKQTAGFDFASIIFFNLIYFFVSKKKTGNTKNILDFVFKNTLIFAGFTTPFLAYLLFFLFKGQANEFLYFQFYSIFNNTRGYGEYGSAIKNFWNNFVPIFNKTYLFWIFSFLGICKVLFSKKNILVYFIFIWFVVNFAGIYYLWWFFPHHFLQILPPFSIFSGFFISEIIEIKIKKIKIVYKNSAILIIFTLFLLLYFRDNFYFYPDFINRSLGRINNKEYLQKVGFNVGVDGWLPFYETAEYLKQKDESQEKIFIWGTIPAVYAFSNMTPASYFSYKYPLLPFELRTTTFKTWTFDVEKNKQKFLKEMTEIFPKYLVIEVEPKKIFDELISFPEFSFYIYKNYEFENQIGNILIYKKRQLSKSNDFDSNRLTIPFEIVKRFSIITKLIQDKDGTNVYFEPIANMGGIIRELYDWYPEKIILDKLNLNIDSWGLSKEDFVSISDEESDQRPDLYFKIKNNNLNFPVSFVRVKSGNSYYSNRTFGVNPYVKVENKDDAYTLYIEPPNKWETANYSIYFIFENGSIAEREIINSN
jgi:hypothetical protein